MKSKQFIQNCVNGTRTKTGACSSIYFDGEILYSYGTHYPLLFKINNNWFINDQGYSSSTGRHLCWAREFADYPVKLPNNIQNGKPTPEYVIECINTEIKELNDQLPTKQKGKTPFNTIVARLEQLAQAKTSLNN